MNRSSAARAAVLAVALPRVRRAGLQADASPIEFVVHTGPGRRQRRARARDRRHDGEGEAAAGAHAGRQQDRRRRRGGRWPTWPRRRATRTPSRFFTGIWFTNPLMQRRSQGHDEGPDADRAAGARAGGGRGEERCAVQDAQGFHRRGEEEARAAQAVGRLDRAAATSVVRQLLHEEHRRAAGRSSRFPGGGERIAALLGGHVNMMVIEPQEAGEHIRAGNMRVLAQVSEKRLPAFPERADAQGSRLRRSDRAAGARHRRAAGHPGDARRLLGGLFGQLDADRDRGRSTSRTTSSRTASRAPPSWRSSTTSSRSRCATS